MKAATHQVIIHTDAINDLRKYYQRAYADAPVESTAWYRRLLATTKSLQRLPDRCPVARESSRVFFEVRELLFGNRPNVFRILFTIDERQLAFVELRDVAVCIGGHRASPLRLSRFDKSSTTNNNCSRSATTTHAFGLAESR